MFTITLFIVFGTTLFSCDEKEHEIIRSTIENTFFEHVNIPRESNMPELHTVISNCEYEYEEKPINEVFEKDSTPIALDEVVITRKISGELSCHWSGGMSYTIKNIYYEINTTTIAPLIQEAPLELPLLVYPNPAPRSYQCQLYHRRRRAFDADNL